MMRTGTFPPALIKELRASVKRLRGHLKANDRTKYIDEDVSFHAAIAKATGNARLCDMLENIQNQIWLFRRKTYNLSSSAAPDAHDALVDALEKAAQEGTDNSQAETVMRNHVSGVRQKLLAHLAQADSHKTAGEKPGARKIAPPGHPLGSEVLQDA